jgi:lipoate-protein ligase A
MLCRLMIDEPGDGAWNMAVDEVLLESAGAEQIAYLRFYRWAKPTLSLGYFQRHGDRLAHRDSLQCPVVRRLTGGGAILHDDEWTYSLALPVRSPLGKDPRVIYDLVNAATLAALDRAGVTASAFGTVEAKEAEGEGQPFLCFQRRSPGDLVVGQYKIMGSAQRRRHGAVLQHGSLLLGRSSFARELPGIVDLAPDFNDASLISYWHEELGRRLGFELHERKRSPEQSAAATSLSDSKFADESWTAHR